MECGPQAYVCATNGIKERVHHSEWTLHLFRSNNYLRNVRHITRGKRKNCFGTYLAKVEKSNETPSHVEKISYKTSFSVYYNINRIKECIDFSFNGLYLSWELWRFGYKCVKGTFNLSHKNYLSCFLVSISKVIVENLINC